MFCQVWNLFQGNWRQLKKYYCKFELDESGFYGDVYQDSRFSQRLGHLNINIKKHQFSATHVERKDARMYEFKVKVKDTGKEGVAVWLGTTKQDSSGIFRPVFRVDFGDGSYEDYTYKKLEFIDKPLTL